MKVLIIRDTAKCGVDPANKGWVLLGVADLPEGVEVRALKAGMYTDKRTVASVRQVLDALEEDDDDGQ